MTPYLLMIVLLGTIAWLAFNYWRIRSAAKPVDNEEFAKLMHNAQIIDVRPSVQFQHKHIIGARNFPAQPPAQFKQSLSALRRDKPILIYENNRGTLTANASLILKKNGYRDVYVLKYGLEYWDGKVKGAR